MEHDFRIIMIEVFSMTSHGVRLTMRPEASVGVEGTDVVSKGGDLKLTGSMSVAMAIAAANQAQVALKKAIDNAGRNDGDAVTHDSIKSKLIALDGLVEVTDSFSLYAPSGQVLEPSDQKKYVRSRVARQAQVRTCTLLTLPVWQLSYQRWYHGNV